MPPTVVSPTILHQSSAATTGSYNSGDHVVLESPDATQNGLQNPLQWVYMPMNHSNETVQHSTKFPSAWRPFPTAQTYPYNCGTYHYNNDLTSPVPATSPSDLAYDLCDRFNDLNLIDCYSKSARFNRIPPDNYLCHLCFLKGHYIRDCPQVS